MKSPSKGPKLQETNSLLPKPNQSIETAYSDMNLLEQDEEPHVSEVCVTNYLNTLNNPKEKLTNKGVEPNKIITTKTALKNENINYLVNFASKRPKKKSNNSSGRESAVSNSQKRNPSITITAKPVTSQANVIKTQPIRSSDDPRKETASPLFNQENRLVETRSPTPLIQNRLAETRSPTPLLDNRPTTINRYQPYIPQYNKASLRERPFKREDSSIAYLNESASLPLKNKYNTLNADSFRYNTLTTLDGSTEPIQYPEKSTSNRGFLTQVAYSPKMERVNFAKDNQVRVSQGYLQHQTSASISVETFAERFFPNNHALESKNENQPTESKGNFAKIERPIRRERKASTEKNPKVTTTQLRQNKLEHTRTQTGVLSVSGDRVSLGFHTYSSSRDYFGTLLQKK